WFSTNSWCCPDCKEPCLPTLALGHWLLQTRLVQNDYSEADLDRMFRASFCPQCHHSIAGLMQPPFPVEWAPSNFARWTHEKAFHPVYQGPPLIRKKIYQSRLVSFNAALYFILSRTNKFLDDRLGAKTCAISALTILKNTVVETNDNEVILQIKIKLQLR
uniref:Uncharacterized protein n=1 Tax=Equus asinus asinus TaxID=83772 RepID=A0A8C4LY38_EQUAS